MPQGLETPFWPTLAGSITTACLAEVNISNNAASAPCPPATSRIRSNCSCLKDGDCTILAKAQHDAQTLLWKQAASHAHGGGLESGIPSFEAAKRTVRYFRKNGFSDAARAFEIVVVGIYKPDKDEGTWGTCARCAEIVTRGRRHDLYECSDNSLILNEMFIKSSRKVKAENIDIVNQECFWMRGILPKCMAWSIAL